jgi:hypothetical protein
MFRRVAVLSSVVVALAICAVLALAQGMQIEWIDYGCNLVWEANGCVCNGTHCSCQERVKYEHWGWSFGGEFPLPLAVVASCECKVFVFFWLSCSDDDRESGSGEAIANSLCYIWTGAYGCDETTFDSRCY